MKRRGFVALIGAALATQTMSLAWGQRIFRVGVLMPGTEHTLGSRLEALRAGLRDLGYVEGGNLILSVRWSEGSLERLSALAAELLRDKPDAFVAGNVLSAQALFRHTRTVPIVLAGGAGVVKVNLAQSLALPGGNVTGVVNQGEELIQKQIELLKMISPNISRLGVLNSGKSLVHDESWRGAVVAAKALNLKLVEVRVGATADITRLAAVCGKGGCHALLVMLDPELVNWRGQIIDSAARLRLPTVYSASEFVPEGGLISYAASTTDLFRRAATHVDKIFKGARPGDLPIEQPTKFELMVNLKTARALGITIPQSILLRADRVIE